MAGRLPSSRRKKKVDPEAPSIEPNGNLIELNTPDTKIVKSTANGQGSEVFASSSAIPSNLGSSVLSSASAGVAVNRQVRVCVTKEEGINSYESEYLENMTESTQSVDYDSPHTNTSFQRHIMEGRLVKSEPLEIFHEGICLSGKPVSNSSMELVSIQTMDEQELRNLMMQKEKPKFGDFEAVPFYRRILEQQKLAKETILSKLDEFFLTDQEDLALKIYVQKADHCPVLNVQLDKPSKKGDVAYSNVKEPMKDAVDPNPVKPVVPVDVKDARKFSRPPKIHEHGRCHMHRMSRHRNDLSSTTPGTSLRNALSISSGCQPALSSFVTGSTVSSCANNVSLMPESLSAAEHSKKSVGAPSVVISALNYIFSLILPSNNCCRSKKKPVQKPVGEETQSGK